MCLSAICMSSLNKNILRDKVGTYYTESHLLRLVRETIYRYISNKTFHSTAKENQSEITSALAIFLKIISKT